MTGIGIWRYRGGALVAAFFVACGDGAGPGVTAHTLSVTPAVVYLGIGESADLTVTGRDAEGTLLTDFDRFLASEDAAIATVDQQGGIRGLRAGLTSVVVTSGSALARAGVNVRPPEVARRLPFPGGVVDVDVAASGAAYATAISPGQLIRIDPVRRELGAIIDLGGDAPHFAFSLDGRRAYAIARPDIVVIEVLGNLPVARRPLGDDIVDLSMARDGARVLVARSGEVAAHDATNLEMIAAVPIPGDQINSIATHPADHRAWVSQRGGTVHEINTLAFTVTRTFDAGTSPQRMAASEDGRTLYVADEVDGLIVIDLASGTVSNVPVGGRAVGIDVIASAGLVVLTFSATGEVAVVDAVTRELVRTFPVFGRPRDVAVTPDEATILVANEAGWIDFIETGSLRGN